MDLFDSGTYRVYIINFISATDSSPDMPIPATPVDGFLYVMANREQRWLLLRGAAEEFFRSPPTRSLALLIQKDDAVLNGVPGDDTMEQWTNFATDKLGGQPSAIYVKVRTAHKQYGSGSGEWPRYPSTLEEKGYAAWYPPPPGQAQLDIGSLIFWKVNGTFDKLQLLGSCFGGPGPDGPKTRTEDWVLLPGATAVNWAQNCLLVGDPRLDAVGFATLMDGSWGAGAEVLLCSCTEYNEVVEP